MLLGNHSMYYHLCLIFSDHYGDDYIVLSASYGVGCTFVLDIGHVYNTEGVYNITMTVYNNVSSATYALPNRITGKIVGNVMTLKSS